MIDWNWIDKIPDGWEVLPLKNCFSFGKGLSITKADLTENGLNVLSYGQIHSKQNPIVSIPDELLRHVSEEYSETSPASLAEKNGFIFADTSEDLDGCGNCSYVDRDDVYAGYHTIVLKPVTQGENWKYLAYLFQTDAWRYQLRKELTEVKLYSVSQKVLKQTSILVPPKPVREAIVSYLDAKCAVIDEAIKRHKKIIENVEEYRANTITNMVTKGLCETPMKDSGSIWYGSIPCDWEIKRFKYIATVKSNLVDPEPYMELPQIGPDLIEKDSGRLIGERTVAESGVISGNHLFYEGQLIYSKIRPALNKVVIAPFTGLCSADMYPIEATINSEYLKWLMLSKPFVEQARIIAEIRVKMPKINQEELGNVVCVVPPDEAQAKIATAIQDMCEKAQESIDKHNSVINKLEEYRKSIIYNAVTGKIDCRTEAVE